MTIGQMWFGWAAEGAQGLNRQQIIAGSGVLTDGTHSLSVQVMTACYQPRRDTFGWLDRGGLRVVFRRRLAGVDGRGREGRFFIHALVAEPPALGPEVLGGLRDAGVWVEDVPEAFDKTLPSFAGPDELALGTGPPPVDDDALTRLLACHLANLARGQRSAIAADEPTAVAIAVGLSRVLPAPLALRGFSTDEPEEHAHAYDLVAGDPPDGSFTRIAADTPVSSTWFAAAALVLDAATGDTAAVTVVNALTRRDVRRESLAAVLHAWASVDRRPEPDERSNPREVAAILGLAASDTDLALQLIDGDGAERVAQGLVDRIPAAIDIVHTAATHERGPVLAELLYPTLASIAPRPALEVLTRLADVVPEVQQTVLRRLIEDWARAGLLMTFDADEALALARSVAGTVDGVGHVVIDGFVRHPPFATTLAAARDLPVAWRGAAVAVTPTALEPRALGAALAGEDGFASAALAHPDRAMLDAVAAAIDASDLDVATGVVRAARPFVPPADADEWAWAVFARLDIHTRLRRTVELVFFREDVAVVWADRLLDAYVEVIVADAETGRMLEVLPRMPLLERAASRRGAVWAELFGAVARLADSRCGDAFAASKAGRAIRRLSGRDRDVAAEVAVDAAVAGYTTTADLDAALRALRSEAEIDLPVLVGHLGRALARTRDPQRAMWAVAWIAERVERDEVSDEILDDPVLRGLRVVGSARARGWLQSRAQTSPSKGVRRWLDQVTETRPKWKELISRR